MFKISVKKHGWLTGNEFIVNKPVGKYAYNNNNNNNYYCYHYYYY